MNLHFRLPYTELSEYLETRFSGTLFEGELARSSAWAKVERIGPIGLDGEGDKLYVSVPLEVKAKLTLREKLFGDIFKLIPRIEQTRFQIVAHFSVRLYADDHWQLRSSTLGSFRWEQQPEVGLGPLKMKMTAFLRGIILDEIQDVAEQIDQAIIDDVALRSKLEHVWSEVQEPFQLHDDPPVWLHIGPREGEATRDTLTCDHFHIDTAVNLPLHLDLGLSPQRNTKRPFPVFLNKEPIEERFSGLVHSDIEYRELAGWYEKKPMLLPDKLGTIQFNSIDVSTSGDRVIMMTNVEGRASYGLLKSRFKADAKMSFRPFINNQKRIEASELTVEIFSATWLLRNLWRFGKKRLKAELAFFVENLLKSIDLQVEKELKDALNGRKLTSQVQLEGKLESFVHQRLEVREDRLLLTSGLEGEMVFVILPFGFS